MVLLKQHHFYYLALIVLLATTYFVFNLGRTKVGRAFKAIRYQDSAAQSMGIDIGRYKLLSFTIGCFIAGIAGSLMVILMGKADIEYFTVKDSIWLLAMLLLGGSGSFVGAYFGVFFILGISEGSHRIVSLVAANLPEYQVALSSLPHFLMALIIIVLVLYEPRGWYHRWLTFKASYRVWPWAHW
ncbi:MAG: branched-chain amino acid ABC transporter permease [Burkholderiaceae bacterium]|nr:branched-chain amino acid ABC transporter permease [Burkholderiaceae bacterium]